MISFIWGHFYSAGDDFFHSSQPESLRRLHLSSQQGETLFFLFRPLAAAQDASPAPLRLSLRPASGGIEVGFVKRRGPIKDETLVLPMPLGAMSPRRRAERPTTAPATVPSSLSEVVS